MDQDLSFLLEGGCHVSKVAEVGLMTDRTAN
jgi:hypothetical protein